MATVHIRLPNGSLQELSHPDSWSDAQVKEAIYKHFPKNGSSIEGRMSDKKGFGGILEDIQNSISNAPEELASALSQLPAEGMNSFSQIRHQPLRAAENLGAGLLEGGKGFINIPANIQRYLQEKGLSSDAFEGQPQSKYGVQSGSTIPSIPETGLQEAILGRPQSGDALLQGIGSFSPYAKLGGLAKGLGGAARRAGAAGAYATGQNQDPLAAALLGLGAEGIARLAPNVVNATKKLDPAVMFRGNLSPEELAANLRATKGTKTPLGSVLEEPNLKSLYENVISNVPFSGAKETLGRVKNEVEGQSDNLMKTLEPQGVQGDTNNLVKSLLESAYKKHSLKKNNLYNERNDIAQKENLKLDLSNFNKLVSDTSKSIEESSLYKNDPDFKRAYRKLVGLKNTEEEVKGQLVDNQGNPLVSKTLTPSITEATMIASKLRTEGKKLKSSSLPEDRSLGSLYKRLGKTLKEDVNKSIEERGSEALKKSHAEAENNYAKNFSSFLDKDVYKFIDQDKDPQKIVREIIKPGAKNDQYSLIQKINDLLPEDKKNLLGYAYLKGAEDKLGNIDPKQLAALVRSLGNRQFKALFPAEKLRQKILDYGNLRGMNESALNVLYNPKTGAQNTQTIIGGMQGALAGTGNPILAALPSLLSRVANKAMTSESVREKIIKRMIEKNTKMDAMKKSKKSKNLAPYVQGMAEAANRKSDQESRRE